MGIVGLLGIPRAARQKRRLMRPFMTPLLGVTSQNLQRQMLTLVVKSTRKNKISIKRGDIERVNRNINNIYIMYIANNIYLTIQQQHHLSTGIMNACLTMATVMLAELTRSVYHLVAQMRNAIPIQEKTMIQHCRIRYLLQRRRLFTIL